MVRKIGIVRETKNKWERRVPLIPADIKNLIRELGLDVIVQPAANRIFSDQEFKAAGAQIAEDLTGCEMIFGIKEVKIPDLIAGKTYLFFSHTTKGQSYNMPMLQKLLDLECSLVDYERMVNEKNQRLIYFSFHAGVAGTIETFWAYGQRLAWEKISSPFSSVRQTLTYADQDEAEAAFSVLGEKIKRVGLPPAISPLVVGITGYGNVSRGAQHMLESSTPRKNQTIAIIRLA